MAAKPGVPVVRRLRGWLDRIAIVHVLQIGFVAILAATALFGGLDTVDTKITPFTTGEPFTDGQYTITIQRATAVSNVPAEGVEPAPPGRRYLGVVASVRNNGTAPGALRNELDLRDQPGKQWIGPYRMSDGSVLVWLGPGLTESVAFIWQLPEAALQPGSSVTLRVWRKTFQELVINYGQNWIETDDYGEITVPVKVGT